MFTLFGIGFTAPLLLLVLAALPILWILLRAVPPAPVRRLFPGVALLLGLQDDESQTDRTPWWLLLLRALAVAAAIIGFAGPVLNPVDEEPGSGPLLVALDASWASARDWTARVERVQAALHEAGRTGRPVAVAALTDIPLAEPQFLAADAWASRLPGVEPHPWTADPQKVLDWAAALPDGFDTLWISDGLDHAYREELLAQLRARGTVRVHESGSAIYGLMPAEFVEGAIGLSGLRAGPDAPAEITVVARGADPAGVEQDLARLTLVFDAGQPLAQAQLSLPAELRNRIRRFEISGQRSAGAVSLTDDALQRREVALVAGRDDREALRLLSPTHYLEQALEPTADLIDGALEDILLANPDVIVLADVATLSDLEAEGIRTWVEEGGLLLRFAGPQLAASDLGRDAEDPLMPVRLRAGGRTVGGAMSWGEPKKLRAFSQTSPFFGLAIPEDVRVSAQVLAQPDPALAERTIASLSDGTPLVTRKDLGLGQVVLFHVTANAEWSSLPLSGLFVQMLERLAVSTRPSRPSAEELAGTTWVAAEVLDAFGQTHDAGSVAGVPGELVAQGLIGPDLPPGLYSGEAQRIAVNVLAADTQLLPARWPAGQQVEGLDVEQETPLKGYLLLAALALLGADLVASLWLSGRLLATGRGVAAMLAVAAFVLVPHPGQTQATDDTFAIQATSAVVLAHVLTGDGAVDRVARAGLEGLSRALFQRTSVEPAAPVGIDIETDELTFFPFLYWPVTADQPAPSARAYARLNRYLRGGGMILFDTRDADLSGLAGTAPNTRRLQVLARPLDVPPLEIVPADHILTRTFYLLQDFPGRYSSREIWVEAAPPDAELIEGMPFRNLNDNVTPVVIGGNDWAAAWAVDESGAPLFPVGRGFAGNRQRELAYRFGINLIMHVLTGNYKSDQVHVPALLDRLGE